MFLFGLVISVAYVPGWTGAAILSGWVVMSLVLPFRVPNLRVGALHGLGLAFLAYASLSLFWTPTPLDGAESIWVLFLLFLCFCYGHQRLDALWRGLGWGIAVSAVLAIAQVFGFTGVAQEGTPAGLFFDRDVLAMNATLVAIALATIDEWLLVAVAFIPILLTHSRASIVALAAAIITSAVSRGHFRSATVVGLSALALVLAVGAWTGGQYSDRWDIWIAALRELTPFGHGAGSFPYPTFSGLVEHAHNDFLELAWLYGLGAVPLFAMLVFLLGVPSAERTILAAAGAFALVDSPMSNPVSGLILACCAGRLSYLWSAGVRSRPTLPTWLATQRSNRAATRGRPIPLRPDPTGSPGVLAQDS